MVLTKLFIGDMDKEDLDITKCQDYVLRKSQIPSGITTKILGYDFNNGINFDGIMDACITTGLQATNFAKAIQVLFLFFVKTFISENR